MILTLFVIDDCSACLRSERKLREFSNNREEIQFVVKNLREEKSQNLVIFPALFVDEELYAYGDVDMDKLERKLESSLQNKAE